MSHYFRHAIALLVFVFSLTFRTELAAEQRPNFLIIMADDCTYNDLPMEMRPEHFDRVVQSYFTVVIDKRRATQ